MNIKALLHNKMLLIGIGGAALIGGVVWWQRGRGGSTSATSPTTTAGATTGGAFPDTTGTDIAEWLGSQESALSQQQQDFLDQLTSTLQGVGQMPTGGGTASPIPPATPPPPVAPRSRLRQSPPVSAGSHIGPGSPGTFLSFGGPR